MKQRCRFIIIVFSLIVIARLDVFGAEIRGKIVGIGQNPVEGAIVLHRESGEKTTTDSSGEFVLAVATESALRLEVVHPDYYEREFVISKSQLAKKQEFILIPVIRQKEEVIVTALRYPELSTSIPVAGTVISSETITDKIPATVNELIQETPGVGAIGSGGFALVPTVRGMARRRVLYLVDGSRLESDRRVGPNASFVSPEDIDRIEIIRSPSSVFYGSDALGGVIHVLTKKPRFEERPYGKIMTGYGTTNGEKRIGLLLGSSIGDNAFQFSFNIVDAGNYKAPGGVEILHSQYTQGSVQAKFSHRTEERDITLSFLGARGNKIGRPNTQPAIRPTWHPRENQNLISLSWNEKNIGGGDIVFHSYVNPNFLETQTDTYNASGVKTRESFSRTESAEYGFHLAFHKNVLKALKGEVGLDFFGRAACKAFASYLTFNASGVITERIEEYPYLDGSRKDLGLFLSLDYSGIPNLDILAGIRGDNLWMTALPAGASSPVKTKNAKTTGFLAVSYKLFGPLTVFANAGRAYRVPSINERFYTGISGRGFIIGQPGLKPETSLNYDFGLKWADRKFFAGLYGFIYTIDDMIERYRVNPTTFTYGNIERGRIKGLELEMEYYVLPGWKLFGNFFTLRGENLETAAPLNDIPPFHVFAGTRFWKGRLSFEANIVIQLDKDNPGPAEIAVDGFETINLKAFYSWKNFSLNLTLNNLLNRTYIARPDSEAMFEPGRNLRFALAYSF